jgi:hypothetical protein
MKASLEIPRPKVPRPRPGGKLPFGDPKAPRFLARRERNRIQWPTKQEIQGVSEQLARIQRVGIRSEGNGDYFKSGELAYQVREIIRATAELAKKSRRVKG